MINLINMAGKSKHVMARERHVIDM